MASADLRDELTCSICLSIYTDPVTLTCGHSFCKTCIEEVLDTQEGSGAYKCPECRAESQERPALEMNRKLRNIAENIRSTHPEQEEAGIPCTYCDSPVPAVKTCLHCEASLCDKHLKRHSKSEEHVLTEPTTSLENRKCSVHKEILKYYCSEDAACICVSCSLAGEHRGHQVETLNEASEKKKEKLRNILQKLTSEREEAEERVQDLEELRRQVRGKTAEETERVTALIREIRERLDALEKQVLSEISRQEEQVSLRVSDLIRQLEIKKEEVTRKMGDIEELCDMTDPITVLQERESDRDDYCDAVNKDRRGENKVDCVRDMDMDLISVTLQAGFTDIVMATRCLSGIMLTSDLFLDINTASNNLTLSSDLKTVCYSNQKQQRPKTPERFADDFHCLLSSRSFSSGRHYCEVEVSESADWSVTMAYPSIDRKAVGDQIKCWGVVRFKHFAAAEDCQVYYLPHNVSCRRLGIFLDYEARRLSFYNLCDPIRHLYTFTAAFTEPLVFLFTVCDRGWVRIRS